MGFQTSWVYCIDPDEGEMDHPFLSFMIFMGIHSMFDSGTFGKATLSISI